MIRLAIALLPVLILLNACNSGPELAASQEPISVDGEESAAFQPITDIPIPQGARLDKEVSLILGGQDKWTGRIVLKIGESPADAFARYTQKMPHFGWRPITSVQAESSVLTFSQNGRIATITIEGRSISGSTVSITMSPRHIVNNGSDFEQ